MKKNIIALLMFILVLAVAGSAFTENKKSKAITLEKQNVTFKLGDKTMKGIFAGTKMTAYKVSGGDACLAADKGKVTTEKSSISGTCTNVQGNAYACSCEVDMTFVCTGEVQKLTSSVVTNICTAKAPATGGVRDPLTTQTPDGN